MGQAFNAWGNSFGATNGTTPVAIVPAPGSGARTVRTIRVTNLDSVAHDYTIQIHDTVGPVTIAAGKKSAVAAGDFIDFDGVLVLTSTTQSFQIVVDAGPTTTESSFFVTWGDYI